MKNKSIKFYKEYKNQFPNNKSLKIYKEEKEKNNIWYFGFPKELLKEPLLSLLETTVYWGDQHDDEDNGFLLWRATYSDKKEDFPIKDLNSRFKFYQTMFNKCLSFLLKNKK